MKHRPSKLNAFLTTASLICSIVFTTSGLHAEQGASVHVSANNRPQDSKRPWKDSSIRATMYEGHLWHCGGTFEFSGLRTLDAGPSPTIQTFAKSDYRYEFEYRHLPKAESFFSLPGDLKSNDKLSVKITETCSTHRRLNEDVQARATIEASRECTTVMGSDGALGEFVCSAPTALIRRPTDHATDNSTAGVVADWLKTRLVQAEFRKGEPGFEQETPVKPDPRDAVHDSH